MPLYWRGIKYPVKFDKYELILQKALSNSNTISSDDGNECDQI